jgi:hypothetical protein
MRVNKQVSTNSLVTNYTPGNYLLYALSNMVGAGPIALQQLSPYGFSSILLDGTRVGFVT